MSMWPILISIPVLALGLLFQTAVISRMTLLSGTADLILLILAAWGLQERVKHAWVWAGVAGLLVGFVSGVPGYVYLASYLAIVGVARLLTRRVWQAPLLAMFSVSLIGTLVLHLTTFVVLVLLQVPLPLGNSFAQIILPSILLNLLFAIPVLSLMRDLANRLFPAEVEL